MLSKKLSIVLVLVFLGSLSFGQDAGDISLRPGFRIEKILEANKCTDCQGIAVDSNGNLVVASMLWMLLKVDPAGDVETLARFAPLKGPNPFDVEIEGGVVYFTHNDGFTDPGLYKLDNGSPVRVTQPGWFFSYLTKDGLGNFYALGNRSGDTQRVLKLSPDGSGMFIVTEIPDTLGGSGICVRGGYLYVVYAGGSSNGGRLIRRDLDGSNTRIIIGSLNSPLNYPRDLVVDSAGNFYTLVYGRDVTVGFGSLSYYSVMKISSDGTRHEILAYDILGTTYLGISAEDVLYISEFSSGLISKIEPGGSKVYLTRDFGHNSSSQVAFDRFNRPYVASFRYSHLSRIDPEARTLTPITEHLGQQNQAIAVDDDGLFYMSNTPNAIYRVNPETGSVEFLIDHYTRTLRFDSFGRLVITLAVNAPGPTYDDTVCTAGILDLDTKALIPYIQGIRNVERGFLFDGEQHFYVKSGRSEGIIKVLVPESPANPLLDVSGLPLFVNLKSKESEIRYFDLNTQGQLLIPLSERGELVLAEPGGSWNDFASGFKWPCYVSFDHNGIAYICDGANGIFRLIGREFVVPTVVKRLDELCAMILAAVGDKGLGNSLCVKLKSASASLERGNIKAAINTLNAFINEVKAKAGKQISLEDAQRGIQLISEIIDGLLLL